MLQWEWKETVEWTNGMMPRRSWGVNVCMMKWESHGHTGWCPGEPVMLQCGESNESAMDVWDDTQESLRFYHVENESSGKKPRKSCCFTKWMMTWELCRWMGIFCVFAMWRLHGESERWDIETNHSLVTGSTGLIYLLHRSYSNWPNLLLSRFHSLQQEGRKDIDWRGTICFRLK